MRKLIGSSLLLLLLVAGGNVAHADVEGGVYWSSAATACTPSPPTIQNDRYSYWYNYVSYKSTDTGAMVFYCSVQPNSGDSGGVVPNTLVLSYMDSTGSSTSALVKADLYRISRSNGSYSLMATASSDSSTATGYAQYEDEVGTMNFDDYYYYVRVYIDRTYSSEDVRFYGAALEYQVN